MRKASGHQPIVDEKGRRECNHCGDFIDPKDWCPNCKCGQKCDVHTRTVKRSDARFCNAGCRQAYFQQLKEL